MNSISDPSKAISELISENFADQKQLQILEDALRHPGFIKATVKHIRDFAKRENQARPLLEREPLFVATVEPYGTHTELIKELATTPVRISEEAMDLLISSDIKPTKEPLTIEFYPATVSEVPAEETEIWLSTSDLLDGAKSLGFDDPPPQAAICAICREVPQPCDYLQEERYLPTDRHLDLLRQNYVQFYTIEDELGVLLDVPYPESRGPRGYRVPRWDPETPIWLCKVVKEEAK